MPKDVRSSLGDRCRPSPYSGASAKRPRSPCLTIGDEKEWEEVRCPVCMEHPHNAVLLLCSSREKGCRPYMCDTSSRHSNCFDQFRKTSMEAYASEEEDEEEDGEREGEQTKLVCPLCRGKISGCTIIKPARRFMDSKTRSCSLETCNFAGNYSELRKHARRVHPSVRPTDVDPQRELEWMSFEEERERLDIFSMQFEWNEDDEALESDLDFLNQFLDDEYEFPFPALDDGDYEELEFELCGTLYPELDWDLGNVIQPVADLENDDVDYLSLSSNSGSSRIARNQAQELRYRRGSSSISESSRQRLYTPTTGRSSRESEYGSSRPNYVTARRRNRVSQQRTGTQHDPSSHRRQRPHTRQEQTRQRPHTRQEQISTLVDFHALRSNLP